MIVSFAHKGLKAFYQTGNTKGIQASHAARLRRQLVMLNNAQKPADMNVPGWNWHPLKGPMAGCFAVSVSGNWRLVFRFNSSNDVEQVNYLDYY